MAEKFTFPELKILAPDLLSTRLTNNLNSSWMNSFNLPSLPKFGDTLPSSIKDSLAYKLLTLKNKADNVMKDWDNSMKEMRQRWENPTLTDFSGNILLQDLGRQLQQQLLPSFSNQMTAAGINALGSTLSGLAADLIFDDSEFGRGMGNIFSQGVTSVTDTMADNIINGTSLFLGLGKNAGASLAGAGVGIAANYAGKGITSAMGDSKLARGVGQGIATGLGTIGGQTLGNLIKTGTASNTLTDSIKAIKAFNVAKKAKTMTDATKAAKAAAVTNLAGLGMSIAGSALGAALGPSKEYGGKYGDVTQIADMAYDAVTAGVNFIPGVGQIASGALALNKGLSNLFGSTSGMTLQDSILGTAFMPAPVKWLNMAGAHTTSTFNNLSWQNSEKANAFMGNAFGNLQDKFDKARKESGKTYGTFSLGAYKDALKNIAFANDAWELILGMADLNELQNIRSLYMSSINNLRYAQDIQRLWSPVARGKYGMKIFNNATNHNIGMRLLSGAALIDNKQMILSARTGVKIPKLLYAGQIVKSDNTRVLRPVVVEPIERKLLPGLQFFNNHGLIIVVEPKQEVVYQDNRDPKTREESHKKSVQVRKQELMRKAEEQTALVAGDILEVTMPSYWVEKAVGEDLGTAGRLAVDLVSPFVLGKGLQLTEKGLQLAGKGLQEGFKWTFNKYGLLVKVPKMAYNVEVKSPYYKIGQDGNLTFDTQNVISEIKAGKLDFINEMLSPEYVEAAIRNMEEAEKMGLSYTPVFEKDGFKSLREDGIIPKFTQDPKHTWHARTGFMGGTPGKATEIEYNVSQPTNIRQSTGHESGHVSRWGMGESKSELEFMKYKASQIFKDNGDVGVYEFGSLTGEGATNMRDLGKDMGITLRTPYPGYEKALEMLKNAEKTSNKGGIVKVLKLTKDAMPYIWRALQGLHFEYVVPTTLTATTLYNINN